MAKGIPSTAAFTITAGSAGAVTLTTGDHPAAMPNGVYTMTLFQDETGYTFVIVTPFGTFEVPQFTGTGWL
jgi:hypothetical protein